MSGQFDEMKLVDLCGIPCCLWLRLVFLGNDYYPGLSNFVTVTIHDTDESASQQYPVILGFIPLNYCPNDSIEKVQKLVCSVPRIMKSVLYGS